MDPGLRVSSRKVGATARGCGKLSDCCSAAAQHDGQGMSAAAQEARLLRELLGRSAAEPDPLARLAPAFFAESASLIETPWALAATPDLAHPKTEGQRPDDLDQALEFIEGLFQLASQDAAVHKLLFEVLHLLKPQSVLRDPDLVERVKTVAAQM
jgi:hypothetical protein